MPKSSRDRFTRSFFSSDSILLARSGFSIMTLSVTSRLMEAGSTPVSCSCRATKSTRSSWLKSSPERLMFNRTGRRRDIRPRTALSHPRALFMHQRSSAIMSPVFSAIGRNSPGEIIPLSGCFHRMSASKPLISPVKRSTIGW